MTTLGLFPDLIRRWFSYDRCPNQNGYVLSPRTQSKGVVCGSSLAWAAGDPACNGETIGEKIGEKTLLASTRDRSALILHIEECC